MLASNHSMLRNDTILSERTTTARRRKKQPFVSNDHSYHHYNYRTSYGTGTGTGSYNNDDIKDISNVQLEQAVRSLQCFEGLLQEQTDHSSSTATYRTFALEYIESILQLWSQQVVKQQQNASSATDQSSETTTKSQRSFAAVVAAGKTRLQSSPSLPTAPLSNKNHLNICPEGNKPLNAWSQPPLIVPYNNENGPKPVTNGCTSTRPSSIEPAKHVVKEVDPTTGIIPALIPFGSYRLGVHSTLSDMDLLALSPWFITRSDFFTSLVTLLQSDSRCRDVHPIPTAYTPVIKFKLHCGELDDHQSHYMHIDLVFARVTDATKLIEYHNRKKMQKQLVFPVEVNPLSVHYYLDDTDLQDQDEISVRSLNGVRVTQMILESVRHDISKFQVVLCAVKHWAQVRGIYSNVLGFLGGVNWAILVAWVCKHYPDANVSKTLNLFFHIFAKWQWNNPVLLGDTIADSPPICNVSNQARAIKLPAWNPSINPRDGLHLMPIITPAYPSMNSSYNVDFPQLRCIQHEMIFTSKMISRSISNCTKINMPGNLYSNLFRPSDFFQRYQRFIQVTISSTTEVDFTKWFRFVESKLRNLINSLETTEVHAWPFARFFDIPKSSSNTTNIYDVKSTKCEKSSSKAHEKCFFIGLQVAPGIDAIDIRHLTMDFLYKINNWDSRNKITMDVTMAYLSTDDIPLFVLKAMKSDTSVNTPVIPPTVSLYQNKDTSSENTAPASDDEDDVHDIFCRTCTY